MDKLQRAWYDMRFELDYLRLKGDAFQDFFSRLMACCHPNDFIKVRPWGNVGDRKNDGYLRSERLLFQCYAPNEMTSHEAINKINEDFTGCLPHWRQYFDKWVFVHNADNGLGPQITARLLELGHSHAPLLIGHWGMTEIRDRFRRLGLDDCIALYGFVPTQEAVSEVRAADLQSLLITVMMTPDVGVVNIHPVPVDKLAINELSDNVAILLDAGRRKSSVVERFFRTYPDPRFGDRVAEGFKQRYRELREQQFYPDAIFSELLTYASFKQTGHEAAALAIIAHLFDTCDIFEATRG